MSVSISSPFGKNLCYALFMHEKFQGLLLQSTPYLNGAKILKVFSAENGLTSLIAKSVEKKGWSSLTTPFCIAEWVIKKGRSDLHTLQDAHLLDPLSILKQDFTLLSTAGEIAQELIRSQLPSKRGGELYPLTLAYLKKLPLSPATLLASFRLKLLLWEGLLSPSEPTLQTDESLFQTLAFAKTFGEMTQLSVPESLHTKIKKLLEERLKE